MAATKDIHSRVILVDEEDRAIGTAEKLEAHQKGWLHRAFSIFILRRTAKGAPEVLLQQRAQTKYHSPGLWTNTCCSHPTPGEELLHAAKRRLNEELNLTVPELIDLGQFHYIAHFENGLIENEVDHVVVGWYHEEGFSANPEEIQAWQWLGIAELKREILQTPERFTPWLKPALAIVKGLV